MKTSDRLIVVLDDDPTGSQTVHSINVYTDWEQDTIDRAFEVESHLFFVLTNSRSFSREKTTYVHQCIAQRLLNAEKKTGRSFMIISRSDSTLRGHYPHETEVLRDTIESAVHSQHIFKGEILIPFFFEGGRYTINDIHYVKIGDKLIPAGETEFADDPTFGYHSSDLKYYCEEKTKGRYRASEVVSISIEELRRRDVGGICRKLLAVNNFEKVIVNSETYDDLSVFAEALQMAMNTGAEYIVRGSASIIKVLGRVKNTGLISGSELITSGNKSGGLIVVGSYVKRSTEQLQRLIEGMPKATAIEIDPAKVMNDEKALAIHTDSGIWLGYINEISGMANSLIKNGLLVILYTSRKKVVSQITGEKALEISRKISDMVTEIVAHIEERPAYILAKGGITSSDIGVKALHVKRALVLGQISPGVPVWKTDEKSLFPGMPYVIFPGNVGSEETLLEVANKLENGRYSS